MVKSQSKPKDNRLAIVTGATGQDGSYLSELLLNKGYNVVGVCRRSSVDNTQRIRLSKLSPNFKLIEGDVTDSSNVNSWLTHFRPDEFYNLAAQSHVGTSFSQPLLTWRVNAEGVLNILEAIRNYSPETRFYQASTSEMFGSNFSEKPKWNNEVDYLKLVNNKEPLNIKYQDESTPFSPQSPYAVAKLAAHETVGLYRRAYNLHASCGILFNHESERRGEQFVTRKITKWIGEFDNWLNYHELTHNVPDGDSDYIDGFNKQKFPKLRLGNLDAYRDWGHAEDYVRAMWLMLQQDSPDDYVVATGETFSVRDFLGESFKSIGFSDYKEYVVQDEEFMRPAEVDFLRGSPTKAQNKLGWKPEIDFKNLVRRMIQYDIDLAREHKHV